VLAGAAQQHFAGQPLQGLRGRADAFAERSVVQRVVQAAIEFDKPRHRGLVQQHGQVAALADKTPGAQEVLHLDVEPLAQVELAAQVGQRRQVGQALLAAQLRQHAPVVGVVPHHLRRQHLGVAEEGVLVEVERHRAVVEGLEDLLVDLRVRGQPQPGMVAHDEFGDVGVADGDEVAARRIEGVEKAPGLAGQCPAVLGKDLLAVVGEAAQEGEVLQLVALAVEVVEERRLVLVQPVHRTLEGVHAGDRVQARVGDDAHRM